MWASSRQPDRMRDQSPISPPPAFLHPLRDSCAPSVIPTPPPSFLRRQESTRPPNPLSRHGLHDVPSDLPNTPARQSSAVEQRRPARSPAARLDSCLRRNDGGGGRRWDGGRAGGTEGAQVGRRGRRWRRNDRWDGGGRRNDRWDGGGAGMTGGTEGRRNDRWDGGGAGGTEGAQESQVGRRRTQGQASRRGLTTAPHAARPSLVRCP